MGYVGNYHGRRAQPAHFDKTGALKMATIVDFLCVSLGLDDAGFEARLKKSEKSLDEFKKKEAKSEQETSKKVTDVRKRQDDAETRAHKDRERFLKQTNENYKKIINTIAILTGATLGAMGVKNFVTETAKSQAQLSRLAVNLGTSGRELDAWGKTIEQVGGQRGEIVSFFQAIQGGINAFKNNDKDNPVVQMFYKMKISFQDAQGKMKNYEQLMAEFSDKLKHYSSQDQMRLIMGMGGGSQSVLDLLRLSRKEITAMYQEQYRLSQLTPESEAASKKLQAAWSRTSSFFESTGQKIYQKITPALIKINELMLKFSSWVSGHGDKIGKFFMDFAIWVEGNGEETLKSLWQELKAIGQWFYDNREGIKSFFSGIKSVIKGVVLGFKSLNEKTGGWAGKILAAVAAIAVLKTAIGGILGMTGASALLKLLGGGAAAGGASLAAKALFMGKAALVGGAGYGGWKIGSYINDKFLSGTKSGDFIGENTAKLFALLGSKEAQEAVQVTAEEQAVARGAKTREEVTQARAARRKQTEEQQQTNKELEKQTDVQKKGNDELKSQTQLQENIQKDAATQTDWLKLIEAGITKLNNAFEAGHSGQAIAHGAGTAEQVAYGFGKATGFAGTAFAALISKGEGGYNSYNTGTKGVAGGKVGYSGTTDLSNKTINEILSSSTKYNGNDKRRMFAVGRFQIIPSTLKEAMRSMGLSGDEKFTPAMQDRIFNEHLLPNGMPKAYAYLLRKSQDSHGALKQIAKMFRAVADPDTGKTYADAGAIANKASIDSIRMLEALNVSRYGAANNIRTEAHIKEINIQTAATDAKGIADEIPIATRNAFAKNSGLAAS